MYNRWGEAYIGGFNIGDEYLGLSRRFGNWRDTHIKIRGTAVGGLQWRFLKVEICSHKDNVHCKVGLPR